MKFDFRRHGIVGVIILVTFFLSTPIIVRAQYCHILFGDGEMEMVYQYTSTGECNSGCLDDCEWIGDCERWCCLSENRDGDVNACTVSSGGGTSQIPNPLRCEDVPCLVGAITDLIAGLVTVIGTIMIIIGGIQYISSAGSEDKARRAKNTVLYAVIGIAIAISVDFIVGFLREILSSGS